MRLFNVTIPIILLISTSTLLAAGTGRIKGEVKDVASGNLLPGANVVIEGTQLGAATNLRGKFVILRAPIGTYMLKASYMGYEPATREVIVRPDQEVVVDFELEHKTLRGQTVVVTAEASGQMAAINQQISAISIKNVVSSARIQELPDATAAESLGRLPGVSMSRSGGEANKVSVRGLTPKIQIEGVSMQSTERGGGNVDISMISPNALGSIEVTKALTPDMEANRLGGTIDLKIRSAADKPHSDLMVQGGYDTQEESYGNYKIVGSVGKRFLNKNLGVYLNGYVEKRNRGTDIMDPDFIEDFTLPQEERHKSLRFDRIDYTDRSEDRRRFGGTLVLDYKMPTGSIKMSNFASRMDRDILEHRQAFGGRDEISWSINKSGNKNYLDQMVNRLYGEFYLPLGTIDISLSHSFAQQYQPVQRRITGYGIYDMTPEQKVTTPYLDYVNVLQIKGPVNDKKIYLRDIGKDSYLSKDREYAVKANYQYPFTIGKYASGSLKLGVLYKHGRRVYDRESINVNCKLNDGKINEELFREMPEVWSDPIHTVLPYLPLSWDEHFDNDKFFDGKYNLLPFMNLDVFDRLHEVTWPYFERTEYFYNRGVASFSHDQDGNEEMKAGYIMANINILNNKLNFIPGIRYENMNYKYTGSTLIIPMGGSLREDMFTEDRVGKETTTTTHENFFPMIHLRVKPTNWIDVRLGYTNAATRPSYVDLVPYMLTNPNTMTVESGNPNLKPQLSENWDLYVSGYTGKVGLLTAGVFYKEIKNGLRHTAYFLPDTNATKSYGLPAYYKGFMYLIPLNKKYPGFTKGLELEWQTNFWYLPFPFNGIVLNANYTYIKSESKIPFLYFIDDFSTFPPTKTQVDTFYVVDQPRSLINISIGYAYKGFSGHISYLYQGRSLSGAEQKSYLNTYIFPYSRWDFKVRQKLPVEGLEIYFNISNITNTGDREYIQSENYFDRQEFWGLTTDIGLRYQM